MNNRPCNQKTCIQRAVLAYCVVLGSCFFTPDGAGAQTDDAYSGVYTLEEVVISAAREGTTAAGTIRSVSDEDISIKGARTVDEALEMVPGLNIRTGGKGEPRVDLRGFRSRHVLLLLDGVPVNSTYDGMFDPSFLPVENIRDIKVTTGGSSVLYGQGALGGVINIITKRGKPGFRGSADQEFGEHIRYNGRYSLSGAGDKWDFFMSGSLYKSDGFELSHDFHRTSEENGGLRENSDRKRKNVFAKLGYTPADNLVLGLTVSCTEGEYGIPPNTINDKSDPFAKTVKYERIDDFDRYSLQLSANYDAPGPWEIKSWFYYNQSDEEANRYDDDSYSSMDNIYTKGTYHQHTRTRITGANIQARCDLERFGLFSVGFGAERDHWESRGAMRDKMVSVGGVTYVDTLSGGGTGTGTGSGGSTDLKKTKYYYKRHFDHDRDIGIYSAALEYECAPLDSLTVLLGYSHFWQGREGGDNDDDYSFVAGLTWDLFCDTRLAGSVSRKVRFPSISQLYDEIKGNPGLETERSYSYEVGITQRLPWNSSLSLTGFCNDVEDYIQKDDYTERNENRDRYRFRGVEVAAETRPVRGLTIRAGYTYLDTDDMSSGSGLDQVQYNPRDKLTLQVHYRTWFGLSAYASLKHINRQYYYSKNAPYQKRKLNEYTLVHVKVSQTLLQNRLCAYLGADNLFDKSYETSYGLPQPGRFVYGGVRVNF